MKYEKEFQQFKDKLNKVTIYQLGQNYLFPFALL